MGWVGNMNYNIGEIIGITGVMGAGKSYFANNFSKYYPEHKEINIIEIDEIRRKLLWKSNSSLAIDLRKKIISEFSILNYDEKFLFNREIFTNYIFSDKKILDKFNEICKDFFVKEIKNNYEKEKLNLLVWVNLIEEEYFKLVNSIIYVDINEVTWSKRNNELICKSRLDFQTDIKKKKELLKMLNINYKVFNNG